MKIWQKILLCVLLISAASFLCIGYATLSDMLSISGNVTVEGPKYDVYITQVAPQSSAGVTVNNTAGTVMFMRVNSSGTARFTIDFVNVSDKTYIYERVIDGVETNIEGVYSGTDIKYSVSAVSSFDEIAPNGGTLRFNVEINVPSGVTAEVYVLKFNFIEKTGMEILPGQDERSITFKYNNGTPDTTIKLHDNEFVPRPTTPIRSGYTFMGWYTDEGYTNAWNFEADVVNGDMYLYAKWEKLPTEYIVTFVPNNGESDYVVLATANTLLDLPITPVRDGYVFIGWYKDSTLTDPWNFDTDKVNSKITLYAGWEIYAPPTPPYLDITFVPNNGQEDTVITVLTGDFIPRPDTPVREGYRFIGWYIDEECTTAWNFEASRPEWHMTLYGGWEEIIYYTVTFKLNNNMPDVTVIIEQGELVPVIDIPTKPEYTFIGWYVDEACTSAWNIDIDRPTSDMTFYAWWQKNAVIPDNEYHSDFMGLVEALLSQASNCLNQSDAIHNAVMNSLRNNKRPKDDPPIVHCLTKSVSGGNMANIASSANSILGKNNDYYFVFEADSDPAYQENRMYLYMYYGSECAAAATGDRILVYKQIVIRGSDGVWYADGTYKGYATVANIYDGGNSGKDVKTVNPYTWMAGELPSDD